MIAAHAHALDMTLVTGDKAIGNLKIDGLIRGDEPEGRRRPVSPPDVVFRRGRAAGSGLLSFHFVSRDADTL